MFSTSVKEKANWFFSFPEVIYFLLLSNEIKIINFVQQPFLEVNVDCFKVKKYIYYICVSINGHETFFEVNVINLFHFDFYGP